MIKPADEPMVKANMKLLQFLYDSYDEYKDNFVNYLPKDFSIDYCKQVLYAEKAALDQQINSLSYKDDVLFSQKGITNMSLVAGGVAGTLAADYFIHKKLADVSFGISTKILSNKEYLVDYLSRKLRGESRMYDPQGLSLFLHDLRGTSGWYNSGRWYNSGKSLTSQLISKWYGSGENLSYSAYLTLYQIATKALAVGAVVGGVGLIQDIKNFRDKKNQLYTQISKCEKMLVVLEKTE